ncbi:MAG: hypothetical protein QOF11_2687 [Chloroflexota bacterium]|jgi:hypothetical protein|nr:hypothetical protein [Chloroflexota bacterium]
MVAAEDAVDAEKARQIRRRWFLPIYLVALLVWVVGWGLDLTVGGGMRGPADALQFVITGLIVGVGLLGEWLVRREEKRGP